MSESNEAFLNRQCVKQIWGLSFPVCFCVKQASSPPAILHAVLNTPTWELWWSATPLFSLHGLQLVQMLQLLSPYSNSGGTKFQLLWKQLTRLTSSRPALGWTLLQSTHKIIMEKIYIFEKVKPFVQRSSHCQCHDFAYLISDLEIVWKITHLNVYIVIYISNYLQSIRNKNKNE